MPARQSLRRLGAMTAVLGAGLLGLPTLAASAASAASAQKISHYNVGATHSPQLLHALATSLSRMPATAAPSPTGTLGVDVASFQHPSGAAITWTDVAAAGYQFAAVKTTEGAYYKNPYALTDLSQARAAGLAVVAYAFAIPNGGGSPSSPVTQADYLLSTLGSDSATVPIMLDIEYDPYVSSDHTNECYGLSPSAMVSWISAFSGEVRAKTGELPIIYTPAAWWSTCTGDSTAFGHTPVWVPDYTDSAGPLLPAGWPTWSFWQYSSSGSVAGINDAGATDLDALNPGAVPS
jgi:GH25 family lysozyme M1 (1,4-beta-N-acetylmuramidase)